MKKDAMKDQGYFCSMVRSFLESSMTFILSRKYRRKIGWPSIYVEWLVEKFWLCYLLSFLTFMVMKIGLIHYILQFLHPFQMSSAWSKYLHSVWKSLKGSHFQKFRAKRTTILAQKLKYFIPSKTCWNTWQSFLPWYETFFCQFSNTVKILAIILDSLDITMNNLLKPFGTKLRSHLVSFPRENRHSVFYPRIIFVPCLMRIYGT